MPREDYDWHIDYIEEWLLFYKSARPRSYDTRRSEIRQFDEWASEQGIDSIEEVTYRTLKRFAIEQNEDYAPKTVAGRVQAIKKCLDEAYRDEVIDEHPLPRDWSMDEWGINENKTLRQQYLEEHDLTEGVTEDEWRQLRANVRSPRTRNQLLIDLLWTTGARASEIVNLTLDDIDQDNRIIEIPDRKKSDPDATRKVSYLPVCDQPLTAWLTDRKRYQCLKDADEDWLFCSRKTAPMYPDLVSEIVRESAWEAGIQKVIGQDSQGRDLHYINAHALRHGHGTWASDRVGIHRVQSQLGHASVELTESTYTHTETEDEENPYHDLSLDD
ncbi:tyrosine-type recombinase/integrase [Halopiger aswanensis]|uniref:Integrase/recombinase XerD n=1 Tax=Halopiger aswanensis TaxID=148449 RepID=A0A3R7EHG7_9EURY|nr:tyrosine-type recombinase/integrase [Halopiger aswanensis]RKD97817.1 integrase/recombinase XerD [Halopiger aswanensis]